jgi:hypothetical protein
MSIAGLKQFQKELDDFYRNSVPEAHGKIVRKVSLQILSGVVQETAVDTGRARGGWTVTTGSPSEIVPPLREGHIEEKKAESIVLTETINKGWDKIHSAQPMKEVIWVTNNVPYIEDLEDGSSKQAPDGMVQRTLERVKEELR